MIGKSKNDSKRLSAKYIYLIKNPAKYQALYHEFEKSVDYAKNLHNSNVFLISMLLKLCENI